MAVANKEAKKKVTKPNGPPLNTHRKQVANGKQHDENGNGAAYRNGNAPDSSLLDDKELLRILMQVRNGNFTVRMPIDETGVKGKICDTLNEIISLNEEMMKQFTRAGNT